MIHAGLPIIIVKILAIKFKKLATHIIYSFYDNRQQQHLGIEPILIYSSSMIQHMNYGIFSIKKTENISYSYRCIEIEPNHICWIDITYS